MAITAQLVKELRERTGAGMMDCKGALTHTDGDIEAAIDYLREKGIAKAAKKAGRIAAEGLCNVVVEGNEAVIYELNSETDFVAKNEKFLDLLAKVGQTILDSKATTTEEALALPTDDKTLELVLADATATIGEKLSSSFADNSSETKIANHLEKSFENSSLSLSITFFSVKRIKFKNLSESQDSISLR